MVLQEFGLVVPKRRKTKKGITRTQPNGTKKKIKYRKVSSTINRVMLNISKIVGMVLLLFDSFNTSYIF